MKASIVIFIIGKVIGYYDFISWWYIIVLIIITYIGVLINYIDWKNDSNGFVTNYLHTLYSIIRYFILRLLLWLPFLIAFFNSLLIVEKYGYDKNVIFIGSITSIINYYFIIKLSGKTPEISDYSIPN